MREFSILFDNGAWLVMEKWGDNAPTMVEKCPSFETAIHAVALRTGGQVLIKLVTPT